MRTKLLFLTIFFFSLNCNAKGLFNYIFDKDYSFDRISKLVLESSSEHNFLIFDQLLTGQYETILKDFETHKSDNEWLYNQTISIQHYPFISRKDSIDKEIKLFNALNQFVEQHENSPVPYVLRASYFLEKAFDARGSNYIDQTSYYQIQSMNFTLKKCKNDLKKALSYDDDFLPANFILLFASSTGHRMFYIGLINKIYELDPTNYMLWNIRLNKAQMKWSGDSALLNQELNLLKTLIQSNPNLIDHIQFKQRIDADNYFYNNNYLHAEKTYQQLYLSGNRHIELLINYSNTLMKLKKKDQSCRVAKQAIAKRPFNYQANLLKAKCLDLKKW